MAKKATKQATPKKKYDKVSVSQLIELAKNWDSISSVSKWCEERNLSHQGVLADIKEMRKRNTNLCPPRATREDRIDAFFEQWDKIKE